MIDDIKGSDGIAPKVLVLECANEAVVDGSNGLRLQRLFIFVI